MHRFPKLFNSNKPKPMESKSHPSTPTQPKPKPKLTRRNAAKNIHYSPPHAPHAPPHAPHESLHAPHGRVGEGEGVSGSSFFSSELNLCSSPEDSCAVRTRSIDVYPWGDRTSFRINGTEGELEFLCKSLGLSGPDDFGISKDEYEAMKVRSLSHNFAGIEVLDNYRGGNVNLGVDRSRGDGVDVKLCGEVVKNVVVSDNNVNFGIVLSRGDVVNDNDNDNDNDNASIDVKLCGGVVEDGVFGSGVVKDVVAGNYRGSNVILGIDRSRGDDVNDIVGVESCGGVVEDSVFRSGVVKDVVSGWSEVGRGKVVVSGGRSGLGIKGERPPAVLLSPPPRMALPVIDAACSSWDILRSFGPEENRISRNEDEQEESSSEDEGQRGAQGDAIEGRDDGVARRERTGGLVGLGSGVLSDSCSFTTNSNDDDSSSTTTDPMSISPNGRLKRQISSWAKGKHLGSGSYGSVYEGIADGGFFFAVKEVSLLDQGDKGREIISQLEQEMAFLSQFEHKNIVRYLGTDKDDSNLYIFLELAPLGSLLSLYQRFRFQDSHVSVYTRQILEGLKYLHERNVVHRDIKCANILMDVDGLVKLADFGLAKVAKLNDAKSCKGTSYWMAPEVVKPNQWYGRAADIWSLGCTVLEMLTQNFPYYPLDGYQAMFKIGSGQPPTVPDSLSRDARDFILKCLQVDPDTRPSAAELLEHSFVRKPHSSPASASPHHHGMRA